MNIINEITNEIVSRAKNGDTIHKLARRIGFAYSAVYKWVKILESYDVIYLTDKGNKTILEINQNPVYKKIVELHNAIVVIEKDRKFWDLAKNSKLRFRFVNSTAVPIWTKGGYIPGDFIERIYYLEVEKNDVKKLKDELSKYRISYSEDNITEERPFIYIIKKDKLIIDIKDKLQVMPLKELVDWCKFLYLDKILEELSSMYNLNLKNKYSEVLTNL